MATPYDGGPFGFGWVIQQQQFESKKEQFHVDWDKVMEAIAERITPQIMTEILPAYVYLSYVISQEMRWRFAPSVPAEFLHHDVLTWTARYLQFLQKAIRERNPEFSDDERQMVDILLNQFFESLQTALQRHIDTAEGDSNP